MKRLPIAAALCLMLPVSGASALDPQAGAPAVPLTDPRVVPAEVDAVPIALLVDLSSGRTLYAKEEDRRFVPASITKVMTLYTAFDLMRRGKLLPNQRMRMSPDAEKKWRNVGSTMFLDQTQQPTVHDLLMGIANVSANDACVVLGEGAAGSVADWVALMNIQARALGMNDSHFGNPNGWMDDGQTYSTAHDLALLARAMLTRFPEYYHVYIGHQTMSWNGITQRNHDPILGKVPGADGIKTGFTNQSGYGFLGSAERNGRRLVMVIGSANRAPERARAATALIDWGFEAFDSRKLFAGGQTVGEAMVQDGAARHVPLIAPLDYAAVVPRGDASAPTLRIVYDGPLEAPVTKGAQVAELEIRTAGQPPQRVPLVAGADVARAGLWERLVNGLAGLVS